MHAVPRRASRDRVICIFISRFVCHGVQRVFLETCCFSCAKSKEASMDTLIMPEVKNCKEPHTASSVPFKRVWGSDCPRVWDQWESAGGTWCIQDLPPEDDELATQLLLRDFVLDEKLCSIAGTAKEPQSMEDAHHFWRSVLAQRTSLACYKIDATGAKTLAAVNVCPVKCKGEPHGTQYKGVAWSSILGALDVIDDKCDAFDALNVDKYLSGAGLLVDRDFRGERLGTRVLQAREPLCRALGIEATVTVFSSTASQRSAASAGFFDLITVSLADLAAAGLPFPNNPNSLLKLMAKKY